MGHRQELEAIRVCLCRPKNAADEVVKWQTSSIVAAIRG